MSGKRESRHWRLVAAALMMVIAGAGCTASRGIERGITWVNPGEQRIVLTAAGFKSSRPIRVRYTDTWQTEEYALFEAEGRQCEIIYAEASRTFTVALDYQLSIKEMVPTWNLNSRQKLVWGPLGRIDRQFETWFYRTYKISGLQRSCAGFMLEGDQIYEDPQGRPGKVLFGYYCSAEGETLADEAVRTLIRGISIGNPNELSNRRNPVDDTGGDKQTRLSAHKDSKKPTAIAFARGNGPLPKTGNPGFPFRFARYYSVSGGREIR
jgi:hypothetical protein